MRDTYLDKTTTGTRKFHLVFNVLLQPNSTSRRSLQKFQRMTVEVWHDWKPFDCDRSHLY